MRVFDTATSTLHPDTGLGAVAPHEVPDGAIVAGGAYPWALYLMKPDASFTRLVDPAGPGRVVQEFRVDRAANAIVWLDADDTTPATSDYYLWTSPYAPTPSGIQRRRVAKIPDTAMDGGARFAVHNGLVLFKVTKDMGLLVRLSDGKGWSIPSEAGHALVKPVWVDDEYVYFNTASDRGTDGLLRIARSTLGAPTVPSGLPDAGP
jgi:hypothetical protein